MILSVANFLPRDEDVFATVEKIFNYSDVSWAHRQQQHSSDDGLPQDFIIAEQNSKEMRGPFDRLTTCTVGIKPSRADYCTLNEKEVEQLMILLAALSIIENPEQRDHILNCRHSVTKDAATSKQYQNISKILDIDNICQHPELQRMLVSMAGSTPSADRHKRPLVYSDRPTYCSVSTSPKKKQSPYDPSTVCPISRSSEAENSAALRGLRRASAPEYSTGHLLEDIQLVSMDEEDSEDDSTEYEDEDEIQHPSSSYLSPAAGV